MNLKITVIALVLIVSIAKVFPQANSNINKQIKKEKIMNAQEIEQLAKSHLLIWSERDSVKRNALMKEVYAKNVKIIDPFFEIEGYDKLDDLIIGLHKQFPDYSFSIAKAIDSHHNIARLFWQLGTKETPNIITGQDIFKISDGKISELLVFIDNADKK
jgi:hypothetical protein